MGADPRQILDLAALCHRGADALARASRAVVDTAREVRWQGPAADRFHDTLVAEQATVSNLTERLLLIRADLVRHAEWLEERHAELRRIESRIRSWAATHPPTDPTPGPNASLIVHYPPPLDPEWEVVATRLRAMGAVF